MKTGWVYAIINKVNDKMYIGQSVCVKKRIRIHFYQLNKRNHNNSHLQRAFNKYGRDNFKIKILEGEIIKDNLSNKEKFWIKKYNTYKGKGYNMTPGGEVLSGENNPMWGKRHSEEFRKKIGKLHRGREPSQEAKDKMSKAATGRELSRETRKKISKTLKNKLTDKDNPHCKTNINMVKKIIKMYYNNELTYEQIANKFSLGCSTIGKICNGDHWSYRENEEVRKLLDNLKSG